MKKVIYLFTVFIYTTSFAQYFELTPAYMNTLSSYNPANSGFNSKVNISTQGLFQNTSLHNASNSFWAISDVKIKALHGGIGVNYNRFENSSNTSNTVKFNYNYQMQLSENQRLSIGIAGGIDRVQINDMRSTSFYGTDIDSRYVQGFIFWDPSVYKPALPDHNVNFSGGLGMIYQFKKLEFGFSANNFMDYQLQVDQESQYVFQYHWSYTNNLLYNSYLDYRFKLFNWMDMNPTMAYQTVRNSGYNLFMTKLNFIVQDKVNFGFQLTNSLENVTQAWYYLGCKIKDRLSINYSYGAYVSRFTNQSLPSHLAGLTFAINQD